jgi:hypothetical protein
MTSIRASVHPDAVWSRYYDLRDTGNYAIYTINVDGEVHYMLLGDELVEIYAANNQLLAEATRTDAGWTWNDELF